MVTPTQAENTINIPPYSKGTKIIAQINVSHYPTSYTNTWNLFRVQVFMVVNMQEHTLPGRLKPYSLVGRLHLIHKCTERGRDATALNFHSINELNSPEMKFSGWSAYS